MHAWLLELELTESVFIRDMTTSARTLKKLRSLGVTIALDDFGTGYSSLSYLQNLHIDALKMDREFLVEAVKPANTGAAVMRCVMEMAHALGLRVIAEGVETAGQMEFLANLGCDEVRGFPSAGIPVFDVSLSGRAGPACTIECSAYRKRVRASCRRTDGPNKSQDCDCDLTCHTQKH